VALDPLDARNHLVVAWSTAMTRHFEQSEVHYELAAELNPNSPKTLVSAALGMAFMGRVDSASRLLERAMDLTSMFLDYQWSHIAVIRYFAGDFEGAIAAADRSKNAIVDTAGWKTAALRKLGRTDEARAALTQLQESIAAAWAGPAAPTPKDILDWFLGAFPIKRDEDRRDLARLGEVDVHTHKLP
jgi:Flp pilus assembly protein TadD